jgi:hypothetical protein
MNHSSNTPTARSDAASSVAPESRWPRALVTTIVAAFVVRLLVYYWSDVMSGLPRTPNAPYAWELGNIARSIVTGKGFSSPLPVDSGPTAYLTPIYPYFVALLFRVFGIYSRAAELGIIYFNCAVSALTCWPLYHIGKKIRDASLGMLSARIWAFLPTAIFCPFTWLWDASFVAFLLAMIFWTTLELGESTRPIRWLGYGALWAFTVMVNPAPVMLLPFFLSWAVLRVRPLRWRRVRLATLVVVVFVAGISPWAARNYMVFNKFILFRSVFGMALNNANNPYTGGSWDNPHNTYDDPVERAKYAREGELAYSAAAQRTAFKYIRSHPGDYAQYVLRRVSATWTGAWEPLPDLFPYWSWDKQAMFYLYVCRLFSLLAFVGLLIAYRTHLPGYELMLLTLFIFPMVYYLTATMLRYRHPIDPIMAVLTAYAMYYPMHAWAARRTTPATTGAPVFHPRPD